MELTQNQKISLALNNLRPNSEWTLIGDDYSEIIWLDETQSKPTFEEITEEIANQSNKPAPTIEEKLASIGLSLDELKAVLS